MFRHFRTLLSRILGLPHRPAGDASRSPQDADAGMSQGPATLEVDHEAHLVAYDENLLERARTQWQFGDWASLTTLTHDAIKNHPDRAKLALLAAAGHLQVGNTETAKKLIRQTQDWGTSKKLIGQILVAGVHNSLGRASAVAGQTLRAQLHFEDSIRAGTPSSDTRLYAQARGQHQLSSLGLNHVPSLAETSSRNGSSFKSGISVRDHGIELTQPGIVGSIIGLERICTDARHPGRTTAATTAGDWQTIVYEGNDGSLQLIRRNLTNHLQKTQIIAGANSHDTSESCLCIAADDTGVLHLYTSNRGFLRSSNAVELNPWVSSTENPAITDGLVTAACFIRHGSLHCFRALQTTDSLTIQMSTYDASKQCWPGVWREICRTPSKDCNIVLLDCAKNDDSALQLTFALRDSSTGNCRFFHHYSTDQGASWQPAGRPAPPAVEIESSRGVWLKPGEDLMMLSTEQSQSGSIQARRVSAALGSWQISKTFDLCSAGAALQILASDDVRWTRDKILSLVVCFDKSSSAFSGSQMISDNLSVVEIELNDH